MAAMRLDLAIKIGRRKIEVSKDADWRSDVEPSEPSPAGTRSFYPERNNILGKTAGRTKISNICDRYVLAVRCDVMTRWSASTKNKTWVWMSLVDARVIKVKLFRENSWWWLICPSFGSRKTITWTKTHMARLGVEVDVSSQRIPLSWIRQAQDSSKKLRFNHPACLAYFSCILFELTVQF